MQSSSQITQKRYDEYEHGEKVWEGSGSPGNIVAMDNHPDRLTRAYILVRNEVGEYTIFVCHTNARCGLSLTRHVPLRVMQRFSRVILGDDGTYIPTPVPPPHSPVRPAGVFKYPVLAEDDEILTVVNEQDSVEPLAGETRAPYFDFV